MSRGGKLDELEITPDLTIPKLFVRKAREHGDRVSIREKEYGIWRPITWVQYLENVRLFALGLAGLGLQPGDKVAMIGDNRPEGLWAEMGALAAGGVAVWLFQDAMLEEVQYIVNHCDARVLVAEGQEEVDKALAIKARCPKLEKIIWDDPRGMRDYDDPALVQFTQVQELGRKLLARDPDRFESLVERGQGSDVCLLFYTSGTTAKPKGALLTHTNMLKMGQNLMRVDPCLPSDDFVSFLPMAWIGEQMMSISCGLQAGFTLNFPEEPETVIANLREIGPHTVFSSARFYEQMVRTVQVKYLDASWLKRKVYETALAIGQRLADMKLARRSIPWMWRVLGVLADQTVHRKLRDHLGLSRIRNAYSGGSALGPDYFRFFHAVGVNLKQIYGQTEIAGISVVHRSGDIKFDTVGTPIPETEVRITPEGEIISRSPSVFQGYYKDPAETSKALRDGWLHSGDTGFIDADGHLVFFDRTKDVFRLSDGSRFSPMYLESRLKFSPFVKDAWVLGHERPHAVAVICIDGSVVGKWAEDHRLAYTSYSELSQHPQVYAVIQAAIQQVNAQLPEAARVRRFLNLHKEFDADDEELTRTRKIRRAFLEERYRDLVEALYGAAGEVGVGTTITYEDGRVVEVKAELRIVDVPDGGGH
ncbi:MAG TPA: AMP-binding protein [Candidatus Methylomirabilis sp.]|nr:AMP-binding protein [Candidatus Methylomirabilis sp.]